MHRRLFIKFSSLVVLFPWLSHCTGDRDKSSSCTVGNCSTNGNKVNVADNHGHTMTVALTDITAGIQKNYDITGASGHTHTVTLTTAHFAMLATGQCATTTSSDSGGHTHMVTITCS